MYHFITFEVNIEGSGVDEVDEVVELFSPSPVLPNNDVELIDDNFSTTFFNVDHDLATPSGVEGPATVFLEAFTTSTPTTGKDKLEVRFNIQKLTELR